MTKIQCDMSGLSLVDMRFVVRVTDAVMQARSTDSQAVSMDDQRIITILKHCLHFRRQFEENMNELHAILQSGDPANEMARKGLQTDLAMVYLTCKLISEMQEFIEPVGLSKDDQLFWDGAAEFEREVLQWSARGGRAENHNFPVVLFCSACRIMSVLFGTRVVRSRYMSCRKCGERTSHWRIEHRYAPEGVKP